MSIKAMSWVFEQTELAGNEKLILLALADHCNDEGVAYPSVERLALKASVSKRSAQRILNKLDNDGWLSRDVRGHHQTTVYKMHFNRGARLSPLYSQGCQTEQSGVTNGAFRGDTAMSPKPSLTVIEPSDNNNAHATRLPDDWVPEPLDSEFRTKHCITSKYLDDQLERFRDYWKAQPGAKGRKLDWQATWRNWLRNSRNYQSSKPNRHQSDMEWLANYAKGSDNEQA